MRGMLVAAGYGTRLDPLTRELPKPAVPVANRPLAWFALDHFRRFGVSEIVVNTHHLAERLREALEPWADISAPLTFVHEPEILGTGGGVRNAWGALGPRHDEDFVVMNAKLIHAPDLAAALAQHRASRAIATLVVRAVPEGWTSATVEVDAHNRVRRIRGEPSGAAEKLEPRLFTGVQILNGRAFADLPPEGDIFEYSYLPWLRRGETVNAFLDEGVWIDAGISPAHYLEANLALATGRARWPGIEPAPNSVIAAPDAHLGPGCSLHECVVGSKAQVADNAKLEQVVVWPSAKATRSLTKAIVTPNRALELP